MLEIKIHVNRPAGQAIGIKEQIAQELERWGDVRVVSIEEISTAPKYEQMKLGDLGR